MKTRQYGLDIMRVLSMLGIIGLHIVNLGGLLGASSGITQNHMAIRILAIICYSSVDVFAMLTGFLYVNKKPIHSESVFMLIVITAFYCMIITLGFVFLKPALMFSDKELIANSLYPPRVGRYWYITSYVFVFFLIPYLNSLIHTLPRKHFRMLILIVLGFLSVYTIVSKPDVFKISEGYSPFWLIFCYMIGAYIALFKDKFPKIGEVKLCGVWLLNNALIFLIWYFNQNNRIGGRIYGYNSPLIVVSAALLLRIFSEITVENSRIRKFVLSLSSASFGVYIIHAHILIATYILSDAFVWAGTKCLPMCILSFFIGQIGIYGLCWIIESVRVKVFACFKVSACTKKIGRKIDAILYWDESDTGLN